MKVICAGLPKTGTKTMASALRTLGYSVYDAPEQLLKQRETWIEIFDGKHDKNIFKKMYKDIDAVADLPACAVWDQILEAFPNSKVILVKRDSEEQWYKSFEAFFKRDPRNTFGTSSFPVYLAICRIMSNTLYRIWLVLQKSREACLGYFANTFHINEMLARSAYRRHEAYVRSVCPQDQLLVYNVREGWEPLCKFLDKPLPEEDFPHLNKNSKILYSDLGLPALEELIKEVKRETRQRAQILGVCILGFLFLVIFALLMM